MEHPKATEEEGHRRIAREIHDDFGQRAAALSLLLGAFRKRLPAGDPLLRELESLGKSAGELGEDLRRFSHDLHPGGLERRGLAAALRDHCEQTAARFGLAIELEADPAELEGLPFEIALALFRVAQEGLANTLRHAGASRVRLRVKSRGSFVHLTLEDDGRGFDLAAARRSSGLGLAGIEERARMFGGRCRIRSGRRGTELALQIPLPEPEGLWGQLRSLLFRHRGLALAIAAAFLVLSAGLLAIWQQARRAEQEARRADATVRFLEDLFRAANPRLTQGQVPDARELLRRGSDKLSRALLDQPLQRARLLETLGGIESELGLYDAARPHLEESLALRRRQHGDSHPEVAATLARLGTLAQRSGQGDPIALFQQALDMNRQGKNPDGPEKTIMLLNQLGSAFASKRRYAEAETSLRSALAAAEQAWGEEDIRLAHLLHNLAGIENFGGDLAASEKLLERTIALRQRHLTAEDPDLLESLEALGVLRLSQKRFAEAEVLLEPLLATTEKIYGKDHPNCARVCLNLALVRRNLGRIEEALALLQRARDIADRKLAPDQYLSVRIREAAAKL